MPFVSSKKVSQFSYDKADRLPTDLEQASLHRLGDRIEPEFSRQFQMAVNAAEDQVNGAELRRAIETQDLQRAEDAVGFPRFEAGLTALSAGYLDSVRRGSENAKRFLPPKIKGRFVFDPMTPAVTDFIRDKSAELVTLVSDETRQALKNSLLAAQRQGIHPRQAAIEIREMIGLTQRQTAALANLRGRLIAEGISQDRIAAQIKRQSARFLRQRGDNIARTETTRALNASRSLVWGQAQEKGLIDPVAVREWITARNENVCVVCGPMDGQQRPIGQPYSSSIGAVDYPPVHPSCRCSQVLRPTGARAKREPWERDMWPDWRIKAPERAAAIL